MLIIVFYRLEPWLSTRGQFEPACQTNHVGNTSTYIYFFIYKVSILQLYQSGIYALCAWAELLLSFPVGTSCSNRLDFEHFDLQNPSATKSIHTNFVPFLSVIRTKVRTIIVSTFFIWSLKDYFRKNSKNKTMSRNLVFLKPKNGVSIKQGQAFDAKYKGDWEHCENYVFISHT